MLPEPERATRLPHGMNRSQAPLPSPPGATLGETAPSDLGAHRRLVPLGFAVGIYRDITSPLPPC